MVATVPVALALVVLCFRASLAFLEEPAPLEQEVLYLKSQLATLQEKVANLTLLQAQISQLYRGQNALNLHLAQVNNTLHHPKTVAFMATLTKSLTQLGVNQHIIFDHVITNFARAYDTHQGHFTAPVSGTYVFFLTLTNYPQNDSSIRLVKNGNLIAHAVAHGTSATGNEMETSTVVSIVPLHAGDQVWAQNEGRVAIHEGLDGNHYSSFAGHLITPKF